MRTDFYVYSHRDSTGHVFYIGKGTGRRAWSTDRHPVWLKYVSQRLSARYTVEIFRDGLTELAAADLEEQLIAECGEKLVNWINPGRDFDYAALETYHRLRDENRKFSADTRALEKSDPMTAIARYKLALERMREYEGMTLERGLVAEMGVGPDWGDPDILNRLTLCLCKLGRLNEARAEANRYFSEFPSAKQQSVGKQVLTRVNKLSLKSLQDDT